MSFQAYTKIPAINMSTLKLMAISPKHYRWAYDHPRPDRKSFGIGRAIHSAVLEPERFSTESVVCEIGRDTVPWRLLHSLLESGEEPVIHTAGKARRGSAWEDVCTLNPGRTIVLEAEWEQIAPVLTAARAGRDIVTREELTKALAVSEAVHADPVAHGWLTGGFAEQTIEWVDEETGLRCKGRVDYLHPDAILELKSAATITPRKFGWQATDLDYFAQLAFYADGARREKQRIIAVESGEPYDVVVYPPPAQAIDEGRRRYRKWLARVLECTERGEWPGIADGQEVEMIVPDRALGLEGENEEIDLEGVEE